MLFQKIKIIDVVKPGVIKLIILNDEGQKKYFYSPRKKYKKTCSRGSSSLSSASGSHEQLEDRIDNDDNIHLYQLKGISPLSLVHKMDLNLALGEALMFSSSAINYIKSINQSCDEWVIMTEGDDVLNDEFKEGIFFYALYKHNSFEWFSLNCEMVEKKFAFFSDDYPYEKVDEAISKLNKAKINFDHGYKYSDEKKDHEHKHRNYSDEKNDNDYQRKNYTDEEDHKYKSDKYSDEEYQHRNYSDGEDCEYKHDKYNDKKEHHKYKNRKYSDGENDDEYQHRKYSDEEDHNYNKRKYTDEENDDEYQCRKYTDEKNQKYEHEKYSDDEYKDDKYSDGVDAYEDNDDAYIDNDDAYKEDDDDAIDYKDQTEVYEVLMRKVKMLKSGFKFTEPSGFSSNDEMNSYEQKKCVNNINKNTKDWCSEYSNNNSIGNGLESQKSFSKSSCFDRVSHRSMDIKDMKYSNTPKVGMSRINGTNWDKENGFHDDMNGFVEGKSSSRQASSMMSALNNKCKVDSDDDNGFCKNSVNNNNSIRKKEYDDNKYISSSSVSLFSHDEQGKKGLNNQSYEESTTAEYSEMGAKKKGLENLCNKDIFIRNNVLKHSFNKENVRDSDEIITHTNKDRKINGYQKNDIDGDFESDHSDTREVVENNSYCEKSICSNGKFSKLSNNNDEKEEKGVNIKEGINIQVKKDPVSNLIKEKKKEFEKKRKSMKKSREYAKLLKLSELLEKKLADDNAKKESPSKEFEKDVTTSLNKEEKNNLFINKNYVSISEDKSSDYRSKKDDLVTRKSKKELLRQDTNRYLENIYQSGIIPDTIGSFEVDPCQEIWVDTLMDIDPILDIKKFEKIIKMDKYLANITHPTPLQSYVWPSILNLFDSFGIGPKRPNIPIESITDNSKKNLQSFKFKDFNGGKTVAYILPLLYLLNNQNIYKNLSKKTRDPLVIILCPTSQVVIKVWKQVDSLLQHQSDLPNYSQMIYSNLLFGRFDSEVRDLRRGCHILVTTPGSLLRVFDAGLLTFNNLCHLVLEEADVLLETLSEQILRIVDNFHLNRNINLDMVPHQLLVFSQKWTKDVQDFVDEHLSTPVIAISCKFEAICYAQLNIELIMCIKDDSKNVIKNVIEKFSEEKILIYTCTDKTALNLAKELRLLTAISYLDENKLSGLVEEWDKMKAGVCVVSDECAKSVLNEATVVIHFDYPSKKLEFAERMWSLEKLFYKREKNNDEKGTVICLVDEDQQESGILKKLAPFFRKNIHTALPEETKILFNEKKDHVTAEKICENFKYFGFCFKQDVCKSRHYFSEALDVIKDQNQLIDIPFPATMRIRVTHVKNPSCFYANLLEWAETTQTKIFKNSENKLLQYRMAFHYGDNHNREKIDVQTVEVGNIYCYKDKNGLFHRVKIIKLFQHDPRILSTHAIVFLVDVGTMVEVVVEDLIKLHYSFNEIKFQAFEVVVCRIKPLDQEIAWNSQAIDFAQLLLQGTDLVGNVVAKVGGVVWMDPLEKCKKLQNLRIWSTLLDVRKNLLDKFYAEENTGHIESILNACRQLYCASDEEETLSKREKGYSTTGYCFNLEFENFENPHKEFSVYISHALNPNTIFVRKAENDSKLLALENEIKTLTDNVKNNNLSLREHELVVVEENRHWKRGKILRDNLTDDMDGSQVFLVDYGSTLDNVPNSKIYPMTSYMRKCLPFQAIECDLVNLVPNQLVQNDDDEVTDKYSDDNEKDFEHYVQITSNFKKHPLEESKSESCIEVNDNYDNITEWDEGISDLLMELATDYNGLPRLFQAHVYPNKKSKASMNGKFKYGVEFCFKRYLYSDNENLKNKKSNGFIVNVSQMLVKEKQANLSEFGIQEVLSSCDVGDYSAKCEAFLRQTDKMKKRNLAYALGMGDGCKESDDEHRLKAISHLLRYTCQTSVHLPLLVTITPLCMQDWHDNQVQHSKLIDTLCFIIDKGMNRNLLLHVVCILKNMMACERCCKEALSKGLLSLVASTMKFWNWELKEHVFYGIDLILECLDKVYKEPLEDNQNNKNKNNNNNNNNNNDDDDDADDEGDGNDTSEDKLNLKLLNEELEEKIRELKEVNIMNQNKRKDDGVEGDEIQELLNVLENFDCGKQEWCSDEDEEEEDEMKYINHDFIQYLPSSHDYFFTFHIAHFYLFKCVDNALGGDDRIKDQSIETMALANTTNGATVENSDEEGDDVDGDGFKMTAESNKDTGVGDNEKDRSDELMMKCLKIINICIRCNPSDVSLYLEEFLKSHSIENLMVFLPLCQDKDLYEELCKLLLLGCSMDRRWSFQLKTTSQSTIDKIQKIEFQSPLTKRLLEVCMSSNISTNYSQNVITNQPIASGHNEEIVYKERTPYVYWCNVDEDKLKVRFDVKEVDPNVQGIVKVLEDAINFRVVSKGELYTSKLDLSDAVDADNCVVEVGVASIVVTLRKKSPSMWNTLTKNKSTFVKHDFEAMKVKQEDEDVEKLHMYEIEESSGEEASDDFD